MHGLLTLRRTSCIALAVVLVASKAAFSQNQLKQTPVSTSIVHISDGHIKLNILNISQSSVTALVAAGTRAYVQSSGTKINLQSVRFMDSVLEPFGPAMLDTGKMYTFTFFGPISSAERPEARSVELKAVILADGSIWGDPQWTNLLIQRRKSAYNYQSVALQIVTEAKGSGTPNSVLRRQLNQAQEQYTAAAKTTAERQIADAIFTETRLLVEASPSNKPITNPADIGQTIDIGLTDGASKRLLLRMGLLEASKPSVKE